MEIPTGGYPSNPSMMSFPEWEGASKGLPNPATPPEVVDASTDSSVINATGNTQPSQ